MHLYTCANFHFYAAETNIQIFKMKLNILVTKYTAVLNFNFALIIYRQRWLFFFYSIYINVFSTIVKNWYFLTICHLSNAFISWCNNIFIYVLLFLFQIICSVIWIKSFTWNRPTLVINLFVIRKTHNLPPHSLFHRRKLSGRWQMHLFSLFTS